MRIRPRSNPALPKASPISACGLVVLIGLLAGGDSAAQVVTPDGSDPVKPTALDHSFQILRANCLDCHTGSDSEGNLDLERLLGSSEESSEAK